MSFAEAMETHVATDDAEKEVLRHQLDPEDFFREVGERPWYTGAAVLEWLGYWSFSCLAERSTEYTKESTMHLNKVTLIGFLGSDAELRYTSASHPVVTLSLATGGLYKTSGETTSRAESHRLVVFGKLTAFAATLKKGTHLHVEGLMNSRTYHDKRRDVERTVWEVRVHSLLKLDSAERAATDEGSTEPLAAEEVAH